MTLALVITDARHDARRRCRRHRAIARFRKLRMSGIVLNVTQLKALGYAMTQLTL